MTAHKFEIGQRVTLGSMRLRRWGGAFEVTRQMPQANGNFQYRVKSVVDGHERVVLEAELSEHLGAHL